MEIKSGLIPDGWEAKTLGEVCGRITTGKLDANAMVADGGYPFFTCASKHYWIDKYAFDCEALLVSGNGANLGYVHYYNGKFNAYQRTYVISDFSTDVQFLKLFLDRNLQQRIRVEVNAGNTPYITMGTLTEMRVMLPRSPEEQRAIAGTLSDIDALIQSLDQLIAKSRDLKQAAMQELLTGNKRLPGFQAKWDQIELGELFNFKNGLNKGKEFFGHGTPIVNYMDVFSKSALFSSKLEGRVSLTPQEYKNFEVKRGDVFFTRTSETTDEIGIASVMIDEPSLTVFSGFLLRGRPKDDRLRDDFKAYCFGSEFVRKQIVSKASYTTRALTNGKILSAVVLPVPSILEQRAITEVLLDMDAELDALEQRRDKTRSLKQGMMQELLTGRIRLICPTSAK
jgi:type I restriction enzyme S subunit